MSQVKCAVCGISFDKDKVKCVLYNSRRYAHYDCAPDKELYVPHFSQEDLDRQALYSYIVELYGLKSCGPVINRQIKEFHDKYGYTYSGMLKSLKWWYEIKKHPVEEQYKGTVQIIGNIYNQACDYYYKIFKAQELNKDKDYNDYQPKTQTIKIIPPTPIRRIKQFKSLEEKK